MGALYHPPGGIIRHDAVVWGYARGADRAGVEIHPVHRGPGVRAQQRAASTAVRTNRGTIKAGQVISATAGWSTLVCAMAGVPLPITTHILQACVTEPVKPLLDVVIVSSQMHVYISQSDRGEFVMGSEIEPWTTYRMQGTLNFLQDLTRHTLELFPQLEHARLLRGWAGLCDLSPRLQPDPRADRGRELPRQRRLGDVRLQGRADRRQDARRARPHGAHARADRAVRARALLRGQAGLRAGRGCGQPLMAYGPTESARGAAHTARLLISCPDGPGSSPPCRASCFERGANIVTSDQYSTHPEHGTFFMRTAFYLPDARAAIAPPSRPTFGSLAERFQMDWRIAYAREQTARRADGLARGSLPARPALAPAAGELEMESCA